AARVNPVTQRPTTRREIPRNHAVWTGYTAIMRRRLPVLPTLIGLVVSAGGCFPTIQTARIDPGLHLDAGFVAIADEHRDDGTGEPDYIPYFNIAYGFGKRAELGTALGVYHENGFAGGAFSRKSTNGVIMPYLKVALLDPSSTQHLAVYGQ